MDHRRFAILVLLTFSFTFPVMCRADFIDDLKTLESAGDDLGLRVLLRRNFTKTLPIQQWATVRATLVRRPNIGFDVVRAWDMQRSVKKSHLENDSIKVENMLNKADDWMLEGKYAEAFRAYQAVAQYMKKSNGKITRALTQLYLNVLHQMARSLYAMGRFADATEVYSWISPVYSQIRQVMFEKMWSAFRAQKFDIALGSIASQQSAYFSAYLDPESYLLKVYILKRLCRERELKSTVRFVRQYLKDLKSGAFTFMDWGKADLSRMSLTRLLELPETTDTKLLEIVSIQEREKERKKISDYLKAKFEYVKITLELQLERVLGFAAIALTQNEKLIGRVRNLPDSAVLEANGYELWPSKGAEEWLDEIGSHAFIGDSNCK